MNKKIRNEIEHQRFSIRKLSIGVTSVLLGIAFLSCSGQNAKADTVNSSQITTNNNKQSNLSNYNDLNKFFKSNTNNSEATNNRSESDKSSVQSAITDNNSTPSADDLISNNKPKVSSTSVIDGTIQKDKTEQKQDVAPITTNKVADQDLPTDTHIATVNNWSEFSGAMQDNTVSEIDLAHDIVAENNDFKFNPRNLVIRSVGRVEHVLDLQSKNFVPQNQSTSFNLTFQNLKIYTSARDGLLDLTKSGADTITFKDVDFVGTRMVSGYGNINVIFEGINTARGINNGYISPLTGKTINSNGADLVNPLIALVGSNSSVIFNSGTFTGTSYNGDVISLDGGNNNITVNSGATANLIPVGIRDVGNQNLNVDYRKNAIEMGNQGNLTVLGNLNIIIGQNGFLGTPDQFQAAAIEIEHMDSNFVVGEGGNVNITTNGDISNSSWGDNWATGLRDTLVYDRGNFSVASNGSFTVTGNNMGIYSGTLVGIFNNAKIDNGTFIVKLAHDSTSAGTGAITLVNAPLTSFEVQNPKEVLLDARANKNDQTNLIGINKMTITNATQVHPTDGSAQSFKDALILSNSSGNFSEDSYITGDTPEDTQAWDLWLYQYNNPKSEVYANEHNYLDFVSTDDVINNNLQQALDDAKAALQRAHDTAVKKLANGANTQAVDNSLTTALGQLSGKTVEDIQNSEILGEKIIGKGAVRSAVDTVTPKIDNLHDADNVLLSDAEKQAIKNQVKADADAAVASGKGTIDIASDTVSITAARDKAIDNIYADVTDQNRINTIIDNDPTASLEVEKRKAKQRLQAEHDQDIKDYYDPSLKPDFDVALSSGEKNIDNAANKQQITIAETNGMNALNQVMIDYKNKQLDKILADYSPVKASAEAISDLNTTQTASLSKIVAQFVSYKNDVEEAEGQDNIQKSVNSAESYISIIKAVVQQITKLQQYTQNAISTDPSKARAYKMALNVGINSILALVPISN
ncbi:YSIRK-type signal peptide-containing protein [Lactobacillus sp. ESL0679]|uniref:pectate lyase-like adhesive domain-containing protein n=1 Tax=Lactobacillus sp. ESL0679 TaxID=2983209 RepID=UPI0023F8440A|nr:pectate lyase-like adhesive domain-containing protein [Lactobacillus sp. ESL0679]MDF7682117.1 YSIRK-type signal peptide-containing protein [Lactobacillus sp. ESL0679]